jgi:hypothetical protein
MLLFMPALIAYFTPSWKIFEGQPPPLARCQSRQSHAKSGLLCIRRMTSVDPGWFHLTSVPTCIDSETREINLCPVLTPERGSRADQKNSLEDVVWAWESIRLPIATIHQVMKCE